MALPTPLPNVMSPIGAETFILRAHVPGIVDLEAYEANPHQYAVSITDEPTLAAASFFARRDRYSVPFEGHVSLRINETEMLGPRLWDEVPSIWRALVVACQGYLVSGIGDDTLDGQPTVIRLARQGNSALLTVAGHAVLVSPQTFIPAILDHADQFFQWCSAALGMPADGCELTAAVRQRWQARAHEASA